ncbi:DUF3800 domain-containing protein [Methylorubrum thiocyanatum]|uniref:DUF3800 domain-containing protein n=1 Tax=Methylorubrum thiocyanatum TaxID=47958 RepID=UPI00398C2FF3
MQKLFFDESGQTGTHLFDEAQPWFTLASTDICEAEAAEIIARCFPGRQGKELKSRSILKGGRGRRQFLDFAREVGRRPDSFCAVKIGKRFTLVCKMVDNLVEPLLRAQGYDFYSGDYARRFANSAHFVFTNLLARPVADGLLSTYNEFARDPDAAKLATLHAALVDARRDAPYGSGVTLDLMQEGARHFAVLNDLDSFEDSNEIHVTAVVECMGHWLQRHQGPFEVIHDESLHFFGQSARWEAITNPDVDAVTITVGAKTMNLPIPVTATVSAHSHDCPSIQLCDLVAGVLSRAAAAQPTPDFRIFVEQAVESGLGEVLVYPIDAGDEFISGPPARAEGPDAVDRIVEAVVRRSPSSS